MKKKCGLISIVLVVLVLVCGIRTKFDFKYFCAGILYGGRSAMSSEILFSKVSGFYDEDFYLSIYAPTK